MNYTISTTCYGLTIEVALPTPQHEPRHQYFFEDSDGNRWTVWARWQQEAAQAFREANTTTKQF